MNFKQKSHSTVLGELINWIVHRFIFSLNALQSRRLRFTNVVIDLSPVIKISMNTLSSWERSHGHIGLWTNTFTSLNEVIFCFLVPGNVFNIMYERDLYNFTTL